jgi:hypothetical protein
MTTPFPPDDDPLAARLRDALHTEADMVTPSDDGLQQIRSGIDESSRPWWRHPAAIAVAAAAVLGVAVGGLAVTLGGDDSGTVAADQTTGPDTSAASTPPESTSGPNPTPTARDEVYVYFVLDDPASGPRLYREEHRLVPKDVPLAILALEEMTTGSPVDPDYTTLWPRQPIVRGYTVEGDTATVELSEFVSLGAQAEELAVQQLVHTVTANDNDVKRVRLLVDGKVPPSGHFDWSEPVSRAPMVDVQGLIWLLTPTQDATVTSPVKITGYGTAFEGTVSWEVRRDGSDEVVAEGFTQAGANGEFDEFSDTVELAPGTYEIRAFESSAEDGSPLHVDSKTFTVE